jgi:N-glycosylase/DNA lyase
MMAGWAGKLALAGPGGEAVDLWRSFRSHGCVDLPPMRVDEEARMLEVTVPTGASKARTLLIAAAGRRTARVTTPGRPPSPAEAERLLATARHVLRLDEDLSGFYSRASADPDLAWTVAGAGRMIRSPTVFDDVVKTICTTNCAWSATERMVGALVGELGAAAPGAPADGPYGRAFPTPAAMAEASEDFYRDVARAGYRGAYLRSLATSVADGSVDLEALTDPELPEPEVEERLLALPGVGPYAAAHIMMMLGRYSRLILDSWTRPKYARLNGKRAVKDATIVRRFRRYGPYAGLAFWLTLTRDWVDDPIAAASA